MINVVNRSNGSLVLPLEYKLSPVEGDTITLNGKPFKVTNVQVGKSNLNISCKGQGPLPVGLVTVEVTKPMTALMAARAAIKAALSEGHSLEDIMSSEE